MRRPLTQAPFKVQRLKKRRPLTAAFLRHRSAKLTARPLRSPLQGLDVSYLMPFSRSHTWTYTLPMEVAGSFFRLFTGVFIRHGGLLMLLKLFCTLSSTLAPALAQAPAFALSHPSFPAAPVGQWPLNREAPLTYRPSAGSRALYTYRRLLAPRRRAPSRPFGRLAPALARAVGPRLRSARPGAKPTKPTKPRRRHLLLRAVGRRRLLPPLGGAARTRPPLLRSHYAKPAIAHLLSPHLGAAAVSSAPNARLLF